MMRNVLVAAAAVAVLCPTAAFADEATDKLSRCLVDSASPRDQATLMQWIFAAMAANPSVPKKLAFTAAEREAANRTMAALFERLMLEDCRKEVMAAMGGDAEKAIGAAFEVLGQRAAEQLMSDPSAAKEIEKFSEYLDEPRWTALVAEVEKAKR